MRNPYEVLGVAPDAELKEIRQAYRRIALLHHPDRHGGSEEAEAKFREASEAYAILSDHAKRASFDRSIALIRSVQDLFARGAGLRVMQRYLPRAPREPTMGEDTFLLVEAPEGGARVVEVLLPGGKDKVPLELPTLDLVWGEAVGLGKPGGTQGNLFLKIQRTRR